MTRADLPATVLQRRAVVYVRQSTAAQVSGNLESQGRQYDLVELARRHGFGDIEVIDDDLGRSASGSTERPGFERLVAELCTGIVGAVLCLEASRLARNGHDWHHLLELCGLVGARVIDVDGIYDPCRPNDRLLLGMKGTISEFELGILHTRMREAADRKAERGELRLPVPVGYVWEELAPALDPDRRIQAAVHTVFEKFQELGSARRVLHWMREHRLHFPCPADGKRMAQLTWRPIRYRNVIAALKNPFYAGAYAYGKSENRTVLVAGRPRKSYGHALPMEQWRVLIKDHHAGYISWEQFERNQEQLARNTFSRPEGGAKSGRGGRALLSGMLRCRRCGHLLHVVYTGRYPMPKYRCDRRRVDHGDRWCISFAAWTAEDPVVAQVLQVVRPLAVEAAMKAERHLVDRQDELRRLRELELEQARYEVGLAERRYAACDPANRLVADELEARWEASMRRLAELEAQLPATAEPQPVPSAAVLEDLATDLQAAWDAPGTTMRTRQRLVRALIEEIIVDIDEDARELVLIIHWKGGQHSLLRTRKPGTGQHRRRASAEAVSLIRSMAGRWSDDHIAATLNRMGLRTGHGNTWSALRVESLRQKQEIRAYRSAQKGGDWVTMSEAAARLGVTNHVVRSLIKGGVLPAEQVVPGAPYQIRAADLDRNEVIEALASRREGRPCRAVTDGKTLDIPGLRTGGAQ